MNTEAMRRALEESQGGKLTFPEVVQILAGAGVESYFADLIRGEERFYGADGESHVEKMAPLPAKVADKFSQADIVTALRAVQADRIRYPEFVKRAMEAGIAGYWAFLAGKRVIYFGRKGEFYLEPFPRTKT
jgi:uncharacterized protein YbcV (DUF1398 family)